MITKRDAIVIGKAICDALRNVSVYKDDTKTAIARYIAREVASKAMDNLWYDVIPQKTREAFKDDAGYSDASIFYKKCGWPE